MGKEILSVNGIIADITYKIIVQAKYLKRTLALVLYYSFQASIFR